MKEQATSVYVIGKNYQIKYFNEQLKALYPKLQKDDICYQVLCHDTKPCESCPIATGQETGSLFYNQWLRKWIDVKAGEVEWPGCGTCHVVVAHAVPEKLDELLQEMSKEEKQLELSSLKDVGNTLYTENGWMQGVEEKTNLMASFEESLNRREFFFYLQPQINIVNGKVIGAEALVRWNHPRKGILSPGEFLEEVEKSGHIEKLDQYIWEEVFLWLKHCKDRGLHPVPVSVNVSQMDLSSFDVTKYLQKLCEKYEIESGLIKVEITENTYAGEFAVVTETVAKLHEAGFLVMMDDFGSGYSSLNMLKNVNVDVLKIDMEFLDMDKINLRKGMGILQSIVDMARVLNVPIVVEGVEAREQIAYLHDLGCRYAQGYYYYMPMAKEQFEKIMEDDYQLDHGGIQKKIVNVLQEEKAELIRQKKELLLEIERQKQQEQELVMIAGTDALTGLYNRYRAISEICQYLEMHSEERAAMVMIDMDNLKVINDKYGHFCGDRVITKVAQTIKSHFRETDVVARIGGDEFIVLCKNIRDMDFDGKMRQLLQPIELDGIEEKEERICTLSAGYACFPEDGAEWQELYQKADRAMLVAKRKGKSRFEKYQPEIEEEEINK